MFLVCINKFLLSFLPLCLILVHHGYTNANCDAMGSIHFSVCGCMPVRESLCQFWCETRTKGLHARFPVRPEEDEGRKVPEQSREKNRRNQRARLERAVNRSWGKPTARMCGPRGQVGQHERMSQHS